MSEQSNLKRHQHCPMRTHVGNCLIIGGFCTSIREDICDALHKSFQMGARSRAVDKASNDAISREYLEEKYWQTLIPKETVNTDVELGINIGIEKMHNVIKDAPSVIPSRAEGGWLLECDAEGEGDNLYRCPECGQRCGCQEYDLPNYCGNCGAKMKGEER